MTTHAHTPGPYTIAYDDTGDPLLAEVMAAKGLNAGYTVARCFGPDYEANARLIADAWAIPQLLDFLRQLATAHPSNAHNLEAGRLNGMIADAQATLRLVEKDQP